MTTTETETPFEIDGPKIAHKIVRFVVKHCIATTVGTVIAQNVTVEKKNQKVQIFVGSYVLGMMAADAGWNRVSRQIHETTETIEKIREALDQEKAKKEESTSADL